MATDLELQNKLIEIATHLNIGVMTALSIIQLSDEIDSAAWAYDKRTKQEVILVNREFLDLLPIPEAVVMIKHELMHRLFYAKLFMRSIPSNLATNVMLDAYVNAILHDSNDRDATEALCQRVHQHEPHNDPSDLITSNFFDNPKVIEDPDIRDMYEAIWEAGTLPRIFDIYQKISTWIHKNAPEPQEGDGEEGEGEGSGSQDKSGNGKGKQDKNGDKQDKKENKKGADDDKDNKKDKDKSNGEDKSQGESDNQQDEEQGNGNGDEDQEADNDDAGDDGGDEGGSDYCIHEIPEGADPTGSLGSIAERSFSDQRSRLENVGNSIDPIYVDMKDTYEYMAQIILKEELDRVVTDILYTYVPEQTIDLMPIDLSTTGEIMVLTGVSQLTGLFWNRAGRKYRANLTVYLDVSPSMDQWIPRVIYMVESLRDKLPTKVCVFSGSVAEVETEQFIAGRFPHGYSTSFNSVIQDFLAKKDSEIAMIVTDGYSAVTGHLKKQFKDSGKDLIVILCDSLGNWSDNGGDLKELSEYCHTIWSSQAAKNYANGINT